MMLIKTAEPNRQIERMLEKSGQRRRLARRQVRNHDALGAVATAVSRVTDVLQDMTASSRVLHHATPWHAPQARAESCPPVGSRVLPTR